MAAMVLMFLSGCIKYAKRTYCLYCASTAKLRSDALGSLPGMLQKIRDTTDSKRSCFGLGTTRNERRAEQMRLALGRVSEEGSAGLVLLDDSFKDILSVDAPLNGSEIVSFAEKHLPGMLDKFRSGEGRCLVYEHVGAVLQDFYLDLYTKNPLRRRSSTIRDTFNCVPTRVGMRRWARLKAYLLRALLCEFHSASLPAIRHLLLFLNPGSLAALLGRRKAGIR